MKFPAQILMQLCLLFLLMAPFTSYADLPEFNDSSKFTDHLRTSPTTGEPILYRAGRWVSVDQRLQDLMKTTREIVTLCNTSPTSEMSQAAVNSAKTKINGLGIPPGVFTGNKFDRTIKDPKLEKIMELEWYLGSATKMKFNSIGIGMWRTLGLQRYVTDSVTLPEMMDTLEDAAPRAPSAALRNLKRGLVPAATIIGTTYFLMNSDTAATAATVGSENSRPLNQKYLGDDSFGPPLAQTLHSAH